MRRFACHYLYVSADGCYSKYVVELEDSGRVRAYFPLKEELSATQWIGGVIIISPMYGLEICSGEKFADFLHRAMLETGCEQPVSRDASCAARRVRCPRARAWRAR